MSHSTASSEEPNFRCKGASSHEACLRTATGLRSQRPGLADGPNPSTARVLRADALRAGTSRGPGWRIDAWSQQRRA